MISYFNDLPLGAMQIRSNSSIGTLATVTGLSASHKSIGTLVRTTLTLAAVSQSVVNGVEYQGTKLFTFPAGYLQIRAVSANLAPTTTTAIATTINSGVTGSLGVGSAVASATTLSTTMQNYIPATAFVTSTVINVAAAAVTPILGTGVVGDFFTLDGTSVAKEVWLNSAFATTGDVDGDGVLAWTGSIVIDWDLLSFSFGSV